MVAGMLVGLANGVLSFRRPMEKKTNKMLHVLWFVGAIVCMSIGLKAVWKSHNDQKPYKANLYTLHSMLGLTAVVLLSQNFLLGLLNFVSPFMSDMVKKFYKPNHIFLGVCTLIMAVMAISTGGWGISEI
jgi:cytochrome b-561